MMAATSLPRWLISVAMASTSSAGTCTTSSTNGPKFSLLGGDALCAGAAVGDAVVAAGAADDQLALRLAGLHVGDAGQLHHRVDGLGARVGEEHAGVGRRADLAQLFRQRLGRLVGERVEGRVGRERADLGGDGVGHLGAAVADRVVPQAGHAVDQLAAVLVPHQGALAALDADEALAGGLGVTGGGSAAGM